MSKSPKQIVEVANRGGINRFLSFEIDTLKSEISKLDGDSSFFLDYVPIKLVTIIENCVRGTVQLLVDHGAPYTERGIELISKWSSKNLSQSLNYFSNRKITIGQLSAHGFSISNLSEIISILGLIHGSTNLGTILSKQTIRWTEDKGNELDPIIIDIDDTFSCIERLFELRHVIVHEIVFRQNINKGQAIDFIDNTKQFASAIDWLNVEVLRGYTPRTQSMMNKEAGASAQRACEELDSLRGGGVKDFEDCSTPVHELEHHWDQFALLTARRHAGYFNEGWTGSISPMIAAAMWEKLLRWRIDNYASQCLWDPVGDER
ncbi:MAG TPA: hypothetical protein VGF71_02205 [Caulobacteraceae bacterium]|jgi:hypothetical protein